MIAGFYFMFTQGNVRERFLLFCWCADTVAEVVGFIYFITRFAT
jgi:hypothetical protein